MKDTSKTKKQEDESYINICSYCQLLRQTTHLMLIINQSQIPICIRKECVRIFDYMDVSSDKKLYFF